MTLVTMCECAVMTFLAACSGVFLARLIDPIAIAVGVVPYFYLGEARRSVIWAGAGGVIYGALASLLLRGGPVLFAASFVVTPVAVLAWWSVFYWGRRLLPR